MRTEKDLQSLLHRIDGRGYKAYKDLQGSYRFSEFALHIDYVQGDPFASPSRLRIQISQKTSQFPERLFGNSSRKIALEDYLTRQFGKQIRQIVKGQRGSGKSGRIQIAHCGQEILERSAVLVTQEQVEVRFTAGLPAAGRRVLSREAILMFFQEIPVIVQNSLIYRKLEQRKIRQHVECAEDQDALRTQLQQQRLAVFVANGSILPRSSGIDDTPLEENRNEPVVAFQSPAGLEVILNLPNLGTIRGMGIPEGITLGCSSSRLPIL